MISTVYLQGDDAQRLLEEGYCEVCLRPAREWARPDRFGDCLVHGDYDSRGNLTGFLCPKCYSNLEDLYYYELEREEDV